MSLNERRRAQPVCLSASSIFDLAAACGEDSFLASTASRARSSLGGFGSWPRDFGPEGSCPTARPASFGAWKASTKASSKFPHRFVDRSPEAIVVHQVTDLPDVSTVRLQGFRVTDPTRTLIDLAGVVDSCTLAASLNSALRNRQSYPELLIRRIDELGSQGRKGIRTLRERGEREPTDSPLEVQAERFLTRHGLEPPRRQYWVEGPNGDRRRLDFAWPELKVGVEVDSRTWHEEYSALERDAGRANFYLDAGWKVLRLTRRGMRDEGPSLAGKLRRLIGHSQLDLDRNADSPR